MKDKRWGVIAWCLISIFPCLSLAGIRPELTPLPPVSHTIPDVPFFSQKQAQRAPASLASVLSFWGSEVNIEELINLKPPVGQTAEGLDHLAGKAGGEKVEIRAYRGSLADLRNHIALDHPVIAFLGLDSEIFPDGHFVVVTGYDDDHREMRAHSVFGANQAVNYDAFVRGWAKTDFWTLMILPRNQAKER